MCPTATLIQIVLVHPKKLSVLLPVVVTPLATLKLGVGYLQIIQNVKIIVVVIFGTITELAVIPVIVLTLKLPVEVAVIVILLRVAYQILTSAHTTKFVIVAPVLVNALMNAHRRELSNTDVLEIYVRVELAATTMEILV